MALVQFGPAFDPLQDLLALQRELERVFDNPRGIDLGLSGRGVFPPVNVFSDRDGYMIHLEVPGVPPDEIRIESQGRTLMIHGRRTFASPGEGSFHRHEREQGEFSRSLQMPAELDVSNAQAKCARGVLTIHVPKREEAKPRQIAVQAA